MRQAHADEAVRDTKAKADDAGHMEQSMNYLIANKTSGHVLGVYEGVDAEAAYTAMCADAEFDPSDDHDDEGNAEDHRADFSVQECLVDNDAYDWLHEKGRLDDAWGDDTTYPDGYAVLWRHENGAHFFAPVGEDHVGNGSGAARLATVCLDDGSLS